MADARFEPTDAVTEDGYFAPPAADAPPRAAVALPPPYVPPTGFTSPPPPPLFGTPPPLGGGRSSWTARAPRRKRLGALGVTSAVVLLTLARVWIVSGAGGSGFTSGEQHAAERYMTDLQNHDISAAYSEWCAQDQALYPFDSFTTDHEFRLPISWQLTHVSHAAFSSRATVYYTAFNQAGPAGGFIHLAHVGGHWRVCPTSQQLQSDRSTGNGNNESAAQNARLVASLTHDLVDDGYAVEGVTCPPYAEQHYAGQTVRCIVQTTQGEFAEIVSFVDSEGHFELSPLVTTG